MYNTYKPLLTLRFRDLGESMECKVENVDLIKSSTFRMEINTKAIVDGKLKNYSFHYVIKQKTDENTFKIQGSMISDCKKPNNYSVIYFTGTINRLKNTMSLNLSIIKRY